MILKYLVHPVFPFETTYISSCERKKVVSDILGEIEYFADTESTACVNKSASI